MSGIEIVVLAGIAYGIYKIVSGINTEAKKNREKQLNEHFKQYYSNDSYKKEYDKEQTQRREYLTKQIEEYNKCKNGCQNGGWFCILNNNSRNRIQNSKSCPVKNCNVKTEITGIHQYQEAAKNYNKKQI